MINTCVICGAGDDDTDLGWAVCRTCFTNDPVRDWPNLWEKTAKVVSVLMLTFALLFLAAALATLAHADDCGIDAPGLCGTLP